MNNSARPISNERLERVMSTQHGPLAEALMAALCSGQGQLLELDDGAIIYRTHRLRDVPLSELRVTRNGKFERL